MIPHKYLEMVLQYLPILLPVALTFLSRFILLTIALLIMLRVQSLNYSIPGLIGSSILASLLDMVPFFGHYAAVGTLLFCVLKMTNSHFVDVRFTVSISYAVMFLMQMLILTLLPVELKVFARTPKTFDEYNVIAQNVKAQATSTNKSGISTNGPANTNDLTVAQAADADKTNNPPATVANRAGSEYAHFFSLKGVMRNASNSMVMVNTGTKTYSIRVGETVLMETEKGKVDVQVDQVTDTTAVLKIAGVATSLRLR